uniref:BTB domain-containing protein n=1 Tax=Anopheles merus TaxID=30066 RepID=A0A182VAT6_ANOME
MADDEQFSLCWNNFNSNLSAGFHESLQRGDLVDVTLAAEGHLVKAHRLILSVCSPYFRKMFTQVPVNQHAFIFLKDVSHSALQDLIQFMYCGEVNVKQDALPAFISTAEALQIKGLTETRAKVQRNRIQSYKLESEESGDDKVVHIQATTSHHVSAQSNLSSQKRTMPQRGLQSHASKRTKMSISASSDGLDTSDSTPAQVQTVQTVQIVKQIPAQVIEPEYIELPIESINPKAEPDYTDETAEIETVDAETEQEQKLSEHDQGEADDDGNYVEDDTYGDMAMGKYEESYLTEGEEGAKPGVSGFVDSYTSDGGNATEISTQEDDNYLFGLDIKRPVVVNGGKHLFLGSRKGGLQLVHDNYLYRSNLRRQGRNGDVLYWECIYNRGQKCRGRLKTIGNQIMITNGRASSPVLDGINTITTTTTNITTSCPPSSNCPIAPSSMVDSTVELKFIKSPWSTPCLVLNNFLYNCHSTRGDIGYWRCHNYSRKVKEERCRARCVVKSGRLSALTGAQHNHPPHTEKIERIVRRNYADEQQELEMMRIQEQQQQEQQHPIQASSDDILLLMATNPQNDNNHATSAGGQQQVQVQPIMRTIRQQTHSTTLEVASAPMISSVTTAVLSPAITDLIKMEDYDLPTVEL